MKTSPVYAFILAALLGGFGLLGSPVAAQNKQPPPKEFKKFHDVLHPLMHDALPAKDYDTLRRRACELGVRGADLVELGVPAGVTKTAEYQSALSQFKTALATYQTAAGTAGNNEQLENSFLAVHDAFEALARLLPRPAPGT